MSATSGKYWVTEPHQIAIARNTASGFGALPPKTVIQVFAETVQKHGDRNALAVKKPVEVFLIELIYSAFWDIYFCI